MVGHFRKGIVHKLEVTLNSRVFRKKHFFNKKIRLPPHVPLWGIYNPDPKTF